MINDPSHPFTESDYKIVKREVLYEGIFRMVRNHVKHRQYNGEWTGVFTREMLERRSAVGILLYDPKKDCVVLIEQFRTGALASPNGPWLLETVAGIYNPGESPTEVGKREAFEEAGAKVLDILPVCEYFVSPGGSNEYIHLYVGKIDASNIDGIYGLAEEHEDIRAFTLSSDEAFQLLRDGKVKTSPLIITLQWLQINREWLKTRWQTT